MFSFGINQNCVVKHPGPGVSLDLQCRLWERDRAGSDPLEWDQASKPGLLLVLTQGDAPNPWEVPDLSVSLQRKHGKQLGKGIVGNCSGPPQRLCVQSRGRAAARVNCCG